MSVTLIAKAATYFASIKGYIDRKTPHRTIMEKRTLSADTAHTYDLGSLVNTFGDYDNLATIVSVKVKDTEVGSPTFDQYLNSEAVIAVATHETTGAITVTNFRSFSVECHITISVVRADGV